MGSQTAPSLDDTEIAERIRAGDRSAEAEMIRRYESGLRAIATVRAGREIANDLVQDTLTVAIGNLRRGEWRAQGPLPAYLTAILRNLVRRSLARARETRDGAETSDPERLPSLDADPHAAAEHQEARLRVRRALMCLTDPHREVVLRHYFEGESAEEIARRMGTPRGTVLSRLHYARLELLEEMNREGIAGHKVQGSETS